jgi:mRNA-degrading endonuclease RelE of RelBE toxin-antitoxin system
MKQDTLTQKRIAQGLEGLRSIHPKGDIKSMKGTINIFRLRIEQIRVIYEINYATHKIFIRTIGNRGDVYK